MIQDFNTWESGGRLGGGRENDAMSDFEEDEVTRMDLIT